MTDRNQTDLKSEYMRVISLIKMEAEYLKAYGPLISDSCPTNYLGNQVSIRAQKIITICESELKKEGING